MLLATTKVPRMKSKIFHFHTGKISAAFYEILLFQNSLPKNLGAAYTRSNTVLLDDVIRMSYSFS
jgi:hypothetical protein